MTTNKERGFYEVEYTCINCGEKITKKIPFGSSIPTMVSDYERIPEMMRNYHLPAPECDFCGCSYWSHGKAIK